MSYGCAIDAFYAHHSIALSFAKGLVLRLPFANTLLWTHSKDSIACGQNLIVGVAGAVVACVAVAGVVEGCQARPKCRVSGDQ